MSNHEQDNGKRRRARRRVPDGSGIPTELVDQLLKSYRHPGDLTGPDGLLKQLTAALVNRAMDAELTHHLGYEPGDEPPEGQDNRRNGKTEKRLRTDQGEVEVTVPRDRDGAFEPQLVPKHRDPSAKHWRRRPALVRSSRLRRGCSDGWTKDPRRA